MDIVPEVVILFGAGLVTFLVGALKGAWSKVNDRTSVLVAAVLGIGVAALIYAAGFVDVTGMNTAQIVARAVLAGLAMAIAASGGRSWNRELRGGNPPQ